MVYPVKLKCRVVGNPQPIVTWRKVDISGDGMVDTSIDPEDKDYTITFERFHPFHF